MILVNKQGDLLKEELDVIIHQANCFHTMGGGVALQIREKYPEAYEADCKTMRGDLNKLGSFSWAHTLDGKIVINMYSQFRYGREKRHTDYDAMEQALPRIIDFIQKEVGAKCKVGIPYKIGCQLGGGDFNIVEDIFIKHFNKTDLQLYIVEFPHY